jgi:hypothetical protein
MLKRLTRTVEVYQDPLDQRDFEGLAILIEKISDICWYEGERYERWLVEFVGDDSGACERVVGPWRVCPRCGNDYCASESPNGYTCRECENRDLEQWGRLTQA